MVLVAWEVVVVGFSVEDVTDELVALVGEETCDDDVTVADLVGASVLEAGAPAEDVEVSAATLDVEISEGALGVEVLDSIDEDGATLEALGVADAVSVGELDDVTLVDSMLDVAEDCSADEELGIEVADTVWEVIAVGSETGDETSDEVPPPDTELGDVGSAEALLAESVLPVQHNLAELDPVGCSPWKIAGAAGAAAATAANATTRKAQPIESFILRTKQERNVNEGNFTAVGQRSESPRAASSPAREQAARKRREERRRWGAGCHVPFTF